MRSSRIWGIIKAEVVLSAEAKLRRITQTEALLIPHILREPNSIIVLLFIYFYLFFILLVYIDLFVFSSLWHKPHELAKVSTLRVTMFFNVRRNYVKRGIIVFNVRRNYVKRGIIVFNSKFGQLPSGYDDFTDSS